MAKNHYAGVNLIKVNIVIEKDGDGYLVRLADQQNLFAFAYSEKEAVTKLKHVVDMLLDYHLEQVNNEQIIIDKLAARVEKQAAQIQ